MTYARDVPRIPFQGAVEINIRSAFHRTFNDLAARLRSEDFAQNIAHDLSVGDGDTVLQIVDRLVEQSTDVFMQDFGRAIEPEIAKGRQQGVQDFSSTVGVVRKAEADASPVFAPQGIVGPRRRVVPTWMRQRPVKFFKIPYRTYQGVPAVPNARDFNGSFGYAPSAYINSAQLLPYDLIVRIMADQREAIREAIVNSITHGEDADLVGVRISNIVGLFPRWQQAVTNYHDAMIGRGAPKQVAIRRANAYGDKLRSKRGIMIARTEIMRAQNYGRLDGWHEQEVMGGFDLAQSIKTWRNGPDACPDCAALGGTTVVGADTPFTTKGGLVVMPPAHPHCRCTATIKPVFDR